MLKLKHLILIGCVFLLSGCHFSILDPKGIIAASEKKLFVDSILLMLIVVIPVILLSIIIPWRYSAKNKKATYRPEWAHSYIMESIWWAIPCVIIGILSVWTWHYTHTLDPYRPLAADDDTVMIEAVAMNWKWLFIYPKEHIATVNFMEIPVNKPVRLFVTAADAPMNSIEIPRLAGQIYAMTGMQTKLNLMATSTGLYSGLSTNFSGNGFSGMKFKVKVVQPAEYAHWLKESEKSPKHLSMNAYTELAKPSENNPVEYYSHVAPGLFSALIIKYMGPMPGMKLGYSSVKKDTAVHQ